MSLVRPLDAFPLIRTSSIEEMEAALARIYVKPNMEIVGRERALRAVHNHCQLQHIGITYGSYGISARLKFPMTGSFAQVFPIRGNSEFIINRTSIVVEPDRSVMLPPDVNFDMVTDADYERLNLVISPAALTAKLNAILGRSTDTPLKMYPTQRFNEHSARLLREHVMFLVNQLSSPSLLPPLLLTEFEQTLMVMFLHVNQHNYSGLLESQPSNVAAWQVRRAEEYIEANWDKPISLEALSAETNVGIRSLLRSFWQTRGYSANEFLRQIRLRHARRMLQHPEADNTAINVAFACGFADLNRFGKAYFQAFGERPDETLNRANGAGLTRH